MGLKCPDTAAIILVELIKTLEAAVRFYSRRTINNIPPGRFVVDIIREIIIHDDDHIFRKGHDNCEKWIWGNSKLRDVGALLRFYGPLLVRAHFPNRNTYHLGSSASMRHIISSIELSFAIRYLVYNVNNGRTKITCNFSIIKLDF